MRSKPALNLGPGKTLESAVPSSLHYCHQLHGVPNNLTGLASFNSIPLGLGLSFLNVNGAWRHSVSTLVQSRVWRLRGWAVNVLFIDPLTNRRQNINFAFPLGDSPVRLSNQLCLASAVEWVIHCHVGFPTFPSQSLSPLFPWDCSL